MSHVKQSGGDSDYYLCKITHPKRLKPCEVECEDIIYALGMTFAEGEAFKATWRNAAMRLNGGKAGDSAIRNGQKIEHYGKGVILETRVREFRDDEQNNEGDLVDRPVKLDVEHLDNLRYVKVEDVIKANELLDDDWYEVMSDVPNCRKFNRVMKPPTVEVKLNPANLNEIVGQHPNWKPDAEPVERPEPEPID